MSYAFTDPATGIISYCNKKSSIPAGAEWTISERKPATPYDHECKEIVNGQIIEKPAEWKVVNDRLIKQEADTKVKEMYDEVRQRKLLSQSVNLLLTMITKLDPAIIDQLSIPENDLLISILEADFNISTIRNKENSNQQSNTPAEEVLW